MAILILTSKKITKKTLAKVSLQTPFFDTLVFVSVHNFSESQTLCLIFLAFLHSQYEVFKNSITCFFECENA